MIAILLLVLQIMRYMCDKQLNEKTEKVLADFIVQMVSVRRYEIVLSHIYVLLDLRFPTIFMSC